MGLTEGVKLCTVAELGEITHEALVTNLDDDASATADNACKWATSWLIDQLDSRGIPVSQIANPERLKRAAAFYACHRILKGGEADEAVQKRADEYLVEAKELVAKYRFVSSLTDGSPDTNLILPELGNQDGSATFGPIPWSGRQPGYGPLP